jgi:hypothetical protein
MELFANSKKVTAFLGFGTGITIQNTWLAIQNWDRNPKIRSRTKTGIAIQNWDRNPKNWDHIPKAWITA